MRVIMKYITWVSGVIFTLSLVMLIRQTYVLANMDPLHDTGASMGLQFLMMISCGTGLIFGVCLLVFLLIKRGERSKSLTDRGQQLS